LYRDSTAMRGFLQATWKFFPGELQSRKFQGERDFRRAEMGTRTRLSRSFALPFCHFLNDFADLPELFPERPFPAEMHITQSLYRRALLLIRKIVKFFTVFGDQRERDKTNRAAARIG
jgi:hypothetical protein